jgi:hypothetical protein
MQVPNRSRWISEIRFGWPVLVVYLALVMARFVVQDFDGRGWGLVTAIVAAALWFTLRPWRLGLIPDSADSQELVSGVAFTRKVTSALASGAGISAAPSAESATSAVK